MSSTPSTPTSQSSSTQDRITVLITVYDRVHPSDFALALRSIFEQTRAPYEVVIVKDGPLTPELEDVCSHGAQLLSQRSRAGVIELEANVGAGPASDAGVDSVTGEWIARLDADDIALPERLEKQADFVAKKKAQAGDYAGGIDLLSSSMAEFDDDQLPKKPWKEALYEPIDWDAINAAVTGIRRLPTEHQAMAKYMQINSPINTPACLLRTSLVRAVGGYGDHHFVEDYDLYARMVAQGGVMAADETPLTYFRSSAAVFARRRDQRIHRSEWELQQRLVSYGLISRPRSFVNFVLRTGYRLLPTRALGRVYAALFHR